MTATPPTYYKGAVQVSEINSAIDDVWSRLGEDPKLQMLIRQYPGLAALDFTGECPFSLQENSAGIDHSMAALSLQVAVGVITGLTKDALIAFFKGVIYPKLPKVIGVGALEERRPPS